MLSLPDSLSMLIYTQDQFMLFALVFVISYSLISILRQIIIKRFGAWSKKTEDTFDDFLVSIIKIWDFKIITVFSLYLASRMVIFETVFGSMMQTFLVFATIFYLTLSLQQLIRAWIDKFAREQEKQTGQISDSILMLIKNSFQFVLWTIVGLLLLQNYGVNVTTLVGGLGIGGIAIAFAVQNILSDLFSSLSIYFDQPFKVGDYIEFGDEGGTVQSIGIKTTRLETVTGDQLVVANKELTEAPIHNYQRLKKRLVVTELGVDLRTSTSSLEKLPEFIQAAFKDIPKTRLQGSFLIDINAEQYTVRIIYEVLSSDYQIYLQTKHLVNLHISHLLSKHKIEYPFGKQEVVMRK